MGDQHADASPTSNTPDALETPVMDSHTVQRVAATWTLAGRALGSDAFTADGEEFTPANKTWLASLRSCSACPTLAAR